MLSSFVFLSVCIFCISYVCLFIYCIFVFLSFCLFVFLSSGRKTLTCCPVLLAPSIEEPGVAVSETPSSWNRPIFSIFLFNFFELNQPNKRTRICIFYSKAMVFHQHQHEKATCDVLSQKTAFFTSILCLATLPPYESRNGHPDHLHSEKIQSLKMEKYSRSNWRNTVAQNGEIQSLKLKKCSRSSKRNTVAQVREIQSLKMEKYSCSNWRNTVDPRLKPE